MNNKTLSLILVAALAFGASVASAYTTDPTPPDGHPDGHGWIQLSDYDFIDSGEYAGSFRYVYDLYNDTSTYLRQANMYFDASGILNLNGSSMPTSWCAEAAGVPRAFSGGLDFNTYPSYWVTKPDFTQAWAQPKDILPTSYNSYIFSPDARTDPLPPNQAWYMDNEWHTGGQYVGGGIFTFRDGFADETGLYWNSDNGLFMNSRFSPGLALTFVIYHPSPVGNANIEFGINQGVGGFVDGPLPIPDEPPPGDFDDDGDVDADDIGDLCANLTGPGVPPSDPMYDLDGDGDADSADMDMLIHDLVEITGGDGTGTEYGDFDLDGDIDTTDLTILATNFGVGTTWLEGNANCDLVIDTTDLTILATNFGFVASGAVPEPATMTLLALGGLAALRRRKP